MKAIRVNLPTGDTLTFREGENGVRGIFEYISEDHVNDFEYVIVSFNPEPDGPGEEWGEPLVRFSKSLVTEIK